ARPQRVSLEPRFRARACKQIAKPEYPLSALGGGEGRSEVGEPQAPNCARPTSPSHTSDAGPSLSPGSGRRGAKRTKPCCGSKCQDIASCLRVWRYSRSRRKPSNPAI